jgi:hypothetical protein
METPLNTKFIIMSRTALDGSICGTFPDYTAFFMKEINDTPTGPVIDWTSEMANALKFDSYEAAQEKARDLYGLSWANQNMLVVGLHDEAHEASESRHKRAREEAARIQTVTAGRRLYKENI